MHYVFQHVHHVAECSYFEDEVWRRARSHCGSEDPVMVRVDQRLVQVQNQNLPLYCIWSSSHNKDAWATLSRYIYMHTINQVTRTNEVTQEITQCVYCGYCKICIYIQRVSNQIPPHPLTWFWNHNLLCFKCFSDKRRHLFDFFHSTVKGKAL